MFRLTGLASSSVHRPPLSPPAARALATSPPCSQHAQRRRSTIAHVIDAGIRTSVQSAPEHLTVKPLSTPPSQQQQQQQHHNETMYHHQAEQQRPSSSSERTADEAAQLLFDFDSSHIPALSPSLAVYFPIGLVIASLRMSLWVAGVLVDAPWFRNPAVVSAYLNLLGFNAKWRNLHLLPKGRHVMVSNHVTPGDLMVLFQGLPQRYTHLITTALPPRVTATHNLPCTLKFATPEVIERLASSSCSDRKQGSDTTVNDEGSIHLFPEGGVTNGRWGMMQFTRGFTRLLNQGDWVVPVALKARTPWGIRTHTLLSSFPANFFWLSFCPWVEMEATVLEPMQQRPGEAKGMFAKRVQQAIANELGLVVSDCNISIKKQLMQKQQGMLRGK